MLLRVTSLLFVLLTASCTYVNEPLNPPDVALETRAKNRTRAAFDLAPTTRPGGATTAPAGDGYFVGLAISGGGLRSANFSAAVMFQLQTLGLLDRVDYISSVSGGSLTAAYYCLKDDAHWNPGEVQKKLTHHFATDGWIQLLLPWNLLTVAFTNYDRSDILAKRFQEVLFSDGKRPLTFSDLRPDRPRLLINATDLQSGKPFVFSNQSFDELNSNLGSYPIAYAVTASAAVPVLLHQVTLRDFTTIFEQYRHLIDGMVNDNLGVRSLVDVYRQQLRTGGNETYRNGAVFIVIDAKTEYTAKIDEHGDTSPLDTLRFSTGLATTALVNRASSATLAELILESSPDNVSTQKLRQERDELINNGYVRFENIEGRPVHVVHIALSRVRELRNLPSIDFSESVNSIETYFNISHNQAYQLYQAADLLVNSKFREQLRQIAAELRSARRVR
ncbi:MAG TPA: patatin-like phospholipase family protein [Tepidisphaeraceae bacterium]|jgi:predicted acylesterase/phospholipase RssA